MIALLQKYDPDLPVVTCGFDECGVELVADPKLVHVQFGKRKVGSHWSGLELSPDGQEAVWIDF